MVSATGERFKCEGTDLDTAEVAPDVYVEPTKVESVVDEEAVVGVASVVEVPAWLVVEVDEASST